MRRTNAQLLLGHSFLLGIRRKRIPVHSDDLPSERPCCRIVIITCIVVAATAASVSKKFDGFSYVGGIIGSGISAGFLLILGAANAYILVLLVRQLRKTIAEHRHAHGSDGHQAQLEFKLEGGGPIFRICKRLFRLINRYRSPSISAS